MENKHFILVEEVCTHYQIDFSFIDSLMDFGLVEITTIEQKPYVPQEQIKDLEKMIRLYYDLNINMEGIDAIAHLLQRIDSLEKELNRTRNRLKLYEGE